MASTWECAALADDASRDVKVVETPNDVAGDYVLETAIDLDKAEHVGV